MRAALADDLCKIRLRISEFRNQLLIAERFFNRIKIGTLHVFDDRDFERFLVGDIDDNHRHFMNAGLLRSTPPAFTGDQFIKVGIDGIRANKNGLNNALLADRISQIIAGLNIGDTTANTKRALAEAIVRADSGPLRDLKREDLELLLS